MNKSVVLLPLFSMMMLSSLAHAGGTREIKAGEETKLARVGKVKVSCLNEAGEAPTRAGEDDRTNYGGLVDSQIHVYLIPGEYYKSFSLLPTPITVACVANDAERDAKRAAKAGEIETRRYQEYRISTNQFWECAPGGLTGSAAGAAHRGQSCAREDAFRKAQYSCMNSGGFECNQALQCYVVRSNPSMMCDYIIPPTPAQVH